MHCEHPNCFCQSEIGVLKDGHELCSQHCLSDDFSHDDVCRCGHVGCFSPGDWPQSAAAHA